MVIDSSAVLAILLGAAREDRPGHLPNIGRGNHPAPLNFGDRFAYALARSTGERLLFKGDDFSKTDIEAC